jgi:hypothetical protein
MKRVTILLAGVMLVLGVATAPAATGPSLVGSADGPATSAAVPPHAPNADAWVDGDAGIPARQPITVWSFDIDPQVTIDLHCLPLAAQGNAAEFISDGVGVEQITQNLMVGFRYHF